MGIKEKIKELREAWETSRILGDAVAERVLKKKKEDKNDSKLQASDG